MLADSIVPRPPSGGDPIAQYSRAEAKGGEAPGAAPGEGAPPLPGATVVVGGAEYCHEGWAEYEVERRAAAESARASYPGRTYVGGEDVVESVMGSRMPTYGGCSCGCPKSRECSPLELAADRLANALRLHEESARSSSRLPATQKSWMLPTVTSEDVRMSPEDAPERLQAVAEDVGAFAESLGAPGTELPPLSLPSLPRRTVSLGGPPEETERELEQLEAATLPYLRELESQHGRLAAVYDGLAAALEQAAEVSS